MSDDAPSVTPAATPGPRQLRLVVTAEDYDAAVAFYRDALGLPEVGAFGDPDGRVVILDAGRATLEITDPPHAAFVDRVEGVTSGAGPDPGAGSGVGPGAGPGGRPRVRVAFEVTDARGVTRRLEAAGARVVAEPVRTPWSSLNARLAAPADLEVTVFEELGEPDIAPPEPTA